MGSRETVGGHGAGRVGASDEWWEGNWSEGAPKGDGVLRYATGERYEGSVDGGARSGDGVMRYANGDVWVEANNHNHPKFAASMRYFLLTIIGKTVCI